MRRALLIQLARLGDLIQTIPAVTAIKTAESDLSLDLLCPSGLVPVGRMLPDIGKVVAWDGAAWQQGAHEAMGGLQPRHLKEAENRIRELTPEPYDVAFVLNQHLRALLAGALLARETKGPRLDGPFGERLSSWAAYVREVAITRRGCRIHLADAFCGLCGVHPPGRPPVVTLTADRVPADLESVGRHGGPWVGLIVGAGAPDRMVPIEVWQRLITQYLEAAPAGRVVMVGQERDRGLYLQDLLPSSLLGRVWDATGRTSLQELASLVKRCDVMVGADTGPLHLAAAVGTRVMGWYFSRARVHETGPYGIGHVVWQGEEVRDAAVHANEGSPAAEIHTVLSIWPIQETVDALTNGRIEGREGWSVWTSHCDRWGAYFTQIGCSEAPPCEREELWRELSSVGGL